MSPTTEDDNGPGDNAESADLPPEFDPKNVAQTGSAVLDHGLPPLPNVLTYQMAIPVAYWAARQSAVVLFLYFQRHDPDRRPWALTVRFSRNQGQWQAHTHWESTLWGADDPIANPGDLLGMDGEAMIVGGGSRTVSPTPGEVAAIWHGRAAPAVRQIALIQDGHEDRRPLDRHFGAWIVCTEQPSPFHVTGLDQNGSVLADITYY